MIMKIVDFPMNSMVIFHSYVSHYQILPDISLLTIYHIYIPYIINHIFSHRSTMIHPPVPPFRAFQGGQGCGDITIPQEIEALPEDLGPHVGRPGDPPVICD